MSSAWIVEAIDVLKECGFGFSPRCPGVSPDQLGLQGFEEGLHCRVVKAISFPAHRHLKSLLAQAFLIVVTTVLTAPVGVVKASRCWLTQIDRHIQRADREVFLHPVADSPTDHTPRV